MTLAFPSHVVYVYTFEEISLTSVLVIFSLIHSMMLLKFSLSLVRVMI